MSGLIKSIQQVSITIPTSSTSATATITSVDTANTALFWNGANTTDTTADGQGSIDAASIVLTNPTTLTAHRISSTASFTTTVNVTVVEFQPSVIKSIQYGSISMAVVLSATATITSVVTANSFCAFNGHTTTYTGGGASPAQGNIELTNPTTVTARKSSTNGTMVCYYCVVEFNSGVLNSSTQQISLATSAASSVTQTVTSVSTSNSMLVYGGHQDSSASGSMSAYPRMSLTNSTTVTLNSGASGTVTMKGTLVEFKSTDIKSVNRGGTLIATGGHNSNTASITAVVTALTLVNFLGISAGAVTESAAQWLANATLTNSTTVTVKTNSNVSVATTVSWEAIEFAAFTGAVSNMFLVL